MDGARRSRTPLVVAALALAAGCSGSTAPAKPTVGSLTITVTGLAGTPAAVEVLGPAGFRQALTGTRTLPDLTPGAYRVRAGNLLVGSITYGAAPSSQAVAVEASDVPAAAGVVYAPRAPGWQARARMPTARLEHAVAEVGGLVVAVGGRGNGTPVLGTLEAYDPLENAWSSRAPMPTPRAALSAVALGGRLHAVGGFGAGILGTHEAWDPATDTWTARAPMPTARYDHALGIVGGKLYAVGGYNDVDGVIAALEVYDPATNAWSTRAPLPTPRLWLGVGVIGGILYAVGGSPTVAAGGVPSAIVEAYDPSTDSWSTRAPLPTPFMAGAVAVLNGRLYAISGYDAVGGVAQVYDPATDRWSTVAPMPTRRTSMGACAANGLLHLVGGYGFGDGSENEAYTP